LPLDLFKEQAERRVKLGMLVGEIVKHHQLAVDEAKVRETVEKFAASYDQPSEVIDWYYGSSERLDPVRNVVLEEQVVDWVLGQVKVTEKSSSFNELIA
jgi:trigger factor